MNTIEDITNAVRDTIRRAFSAYPVDIQTSPEEETTLWVQVFAVRAEDVRAVKDMILQLQDEVIDAECGILLLPMVKNIEVTKKYYPQFAPQDPAGACGMFSGLLDTLPSQAYEMHRGLLESLTVEVEHPVFSSAQIEYQEAGYAPTRERGRQTEVPASADESRYAMAA
jgi:hypothetical protein